MRDTDRIVKLLLHQIDQIDLLGQPLAVYLRCAITGILAQILLVVMCLVMIICKKLERPYRLIDSRSYVAESNGIANLL